jgi:hypothetical protein
VLCLACAALAILASVQREGISAMPTKPASTTPAAADGDGDLMGSLQNVSKVLGAFNSAVAAIGSIETLIGLFSGAKSSTQMMLEAINALTKAVQEGLDKLNNTVTAQTDFQRWQHYADQLQSWQTTIATHANALNTVAQAADGSLTVIAENGQQISVQQWCEGGAGVTGVLDDLASIVDTFSAWFTASVAPAAPSPLQLWGELSTTAAKAGFSGFAGETLHSLLFAWTQSLYGMVSCATFVRNGALRLYKNTANPKAQYVDLKSKLMALGDATHANGAWAAIGATFKDYEAKDIVADNHFCALASADATCNDMSQDISRGSGITLFWADKTDAPANCYITNLQLLYYDFPQDDTRLWYLQGTPVQLGTDGTRTILAPITTMPGGYQHATDVPFGKFYEHLVDNDWDIQLGVGAGYVPEPTTPNHNISNVVTGFQIASIGTCIMVALRYGRMDLSDPNNQTITTVDPAYYGNTSVSALSSIFFIGQDVQFGDLRPAGTTSTYPVTNASFIQSGNRLSLAVRSAWRGYAADMFQPSNLVGYWPPKS